MYHHYIVGGISFDLITDIAINSDGNYYLSTGASYSMFTGHLQYADIAYPIITDSTQYKQATSKSTYDLQYLNIPIMIKMRTNEIGYMRYFGQIGLITGFNLKAKQDLSTEYEESGEKTLESPDIDINDKINLMNLQLKVGFGIEYNLTGNTNFFAAINYQHGLIDVLGGLAYELTTAGMVTEVVSGTTTTPKPRNIEEKGQTGAVSLSVGIFF